MSLSRLFEDSHDKKRFVFDIDGVLCTYDPDTEWCEGATPIQENINLVNYLHAQGHHICIHTARPVKYLHDTLAQLKKWGINYDDICFVKPLGDYYIDDRAVSTDFLRGMIFKGDL